MKKLILNNQNINYGNGGFLKCSAILPGAVLSQFFSLRFFFMNKKKELIWKKQSQLNRMAKYF